MKILKVFGFIIFIISLCLLIVVNTDLMGGIVFSLTICLGYLFRKTLLTLFKAFWNLTFERKMMLLVTIAILIAVIFYSWGVWKTKISYHKYSYSGYEQYDPNPSKKLKFTFPSNPSGKLKFTF